MTYIGLKFIYIYQLVVSPWLGRNCRFEPTCSQYAKESLKEFGFFKGTCLTLWRVLRCQPFAKDGFDPVPKKRKKRC